MELAPLKMVVAICGLCLPHVSYALMQKQVILVQEDLIDFIYIHQLGVVIEKD